MKAIRSVLSRYRLMISMLVLVMLLGVLAIRPGLAQSGEICEMGCWDWSQSSGCKKCMYCCSWDDGMWACNEQHSYCCDTAVN